MVPYGSDVGCGTDLESLFSNFFLTGAYCVSTELPISQIRSANDIHNSARVGTATIYSTAGYFLMINALQRVGTLKNENFDFILVDNYKSRLN